MNSAYLVAGYGWYGLSIYYDDLAGNDFFDPFLPLVGGPPVIIDGERCA